MKNKGARHSHLILKIINKCIEAYEDTGLYHAMMEVKDEKPLSIEEVLIELENE